MSALDEMAVARALNSVSGELVKLVMAQLSASQTQTAPPVEEPAAPSSVETREMLQAQPQEDPREGFSARAPNASGRILPEDIAQEDEPVEEEVFQPSQVRRSAAYPGAVQPPGKDARAASPKRGRPKTVQAEDSYILSKMTPLSFRATPDIVETIAELKERHRHTTQSLVLDAIQYRYPKEIHIPMELRTPQRLPAHVRNRHA